VEFEIV
jgi:hypothetical protein